VSPPSGPLPRHGPLPLGILLAGGASRRFGRQKVVEPLDGVPLFHHPLHALLATCGDVVIVLAVGAPDLPLPDGALRARFVRDAISHEGPLVGTLAGLSNVHRGTELAVLAAADMPGLRPELISLMLSQPGSSERSAVVLADKEGRRPLPAVLRVEAALPLAESLVRDGERRLRALIDSLDAEVVAEATWSTADPRGDWLRDVDVPEDLRRGR
jgi:molybdopterin-guanine dinucleotide biosynthesis protein A